MPKVLRISIQVYAVLTALLYGIIFSGQVLGFSAIYRPLLAILITLLVGVVVTWAYIAFGGKAFFQTIFAAHQTHKPAWLETTFYIAGLALLILLILFPLILWPYSPVNETLTWDAGLYHFPKAVEMYRTGSAWDLSLSYGEYPFGFESLLSMGLGITGSTALFGFMHALIALYLFMTLWFLALRYSRLSSGLLFFLSAALLFSGALPVESNIWWIFKFLLFTIGKNDLLLGVALLAAIFHSPIGSRENHHNSHPFGLAFHSMIALSVKPNAFLVVGVLWLVALWKWSRPALIDLPSHPKVRFKGALHRNLLITLAVTLLPGMLWVVRNFFAQGALFSPGVMVAQKWSIFSNLLNPWFYNYIPRHLVLLTTLLALTLVFALAFRLPDRTLAWAFALLFATFIITPASAFAGNTQAPAEIAWRFAVAPLAFAYLVLLALFDVPLRAVYSWLQRFTALQIVSALLVLGFSAWLIGQNSFLLTINPKNAIVAHDQFRDPVGVDGYHSAYDYVQKNVHNAVIYVENGLPFYVYDKGFTNTVTRSRPADYEVVFQTDWFDTGVTAYPEWVNDSGWQQSWMLLYEDSQGRVYRRNP
jgi:hypothetical protein